MSHRSSGPLLLAALAPLLFAACNDDHECSTPGDAGAIDAAALPDGPSIGQCQGDSSPSHKLDVLFVVDNSGSMGEEQASLAANFPQFMAVLRNIEGGLPDVHIGVISSNMGAGGFSVTGCGGVGDDGQLQATQRGLTACPTPTGAPFIIDSVNDDGTRTTNYTGALEDNFSCIAQLGTNGCGFEQHLASLERALDPTNTFNAGFLRPDAYLAVVIIADEDDCSATNAAVFDPNDTSLTGTLGPLVSFRCTEFGITCDEGNIGRTAASYTGCRPRSDSPYLTDPSAVADFLKGIKCDPNKLLVAGIIGNADPVVVGLDEQSRPRLQASCSSSANGTADPAVRIDWLLKQFPGSVTTSICNNDLSAALQTIAERLAGTVGP
jgi:hypothetical protein